MPFRRPGSPEWLLAGNAVQKVLAGNVVQKVGAGNAVQKVLPTLTPP